jgi:hypothetical protein
VVQVIREGGVAATALAAVALCATAVAAAVVAVPEVVEVDLTRYRTVLTDSQYSNIPVPVHHLLLV